MGAIQSSVNQILGAAERGIAGLQIKKIGTGIKDLKESKSEVPGVVPQAVSGAEKKAYKEFVNNPNITKLQQQQTNMAVQNALWKERMSNYKQSLSDRANTLVDQKNNMKDLVLSIGGRKVDANIGNLLELNPQLKENK